MHRLSRKTAEWKICKGRNLDGSPKSKEHEDEGLHKLEFSLAANTQNGSEIRPGKNQGASEAKELIPKGQNLAGDLCARSSRAEAGPVHQEKYFTQPSGHGVQAKIIFPCC
jgi:hypothetical protein